MMAVPTTPMDDRHVNSPDLRQYRRRYAYKSEWEAIYGYIVGPNIPSACEPPELGETNDLAEKCRNDCGQFIYAGIPAFIRG